MENYVVKRHNGKFIPSFKGADGLKILSPTQGNHSSP